MSTMRIRRVWLTEEMMTAVLTYGCLVTGRRTVVEGLPSGAILAGCGRAAETGQIWFDFKHESFEEISDRKNPPPLVIRFLPVRVMGLPVEGVVGGR